MRHQSGKALFPFIIVVLVVISGYLYLPASEGKMSGNSAPVTSVQAHTVTKEERIIAVHSIGSARANQAINVSSVQSDYVAALFFDDGDVVKKGDKLVQLRDAEEKLDIEALKVTLKEEIRQLNRLKDLAKTQSAARSQLEAQSAKVDTLTAQLEATKTKLAEMTIYAPFDGLLGTRNISIGSFVNNNTVITTLDDISIIKVDFQVPEKYLAQLQLGMQVNAQSEAYPEQLFTGKVSHIDPRINEQTRSVRVTASFTNLDHKLRPGMLLHMGLELARLQALVVPEKSIIPRQDKHFVFVIDDQGKAQQREVHLQTRFSGWVAIDEGLTEGQQVITEGTLKIRSGSKVEIKG
ncbi:MULTISPECIES: efflux RND transporter periplasmic adaptor subunit [unclassified Pseudoalteromonas]|uniref:efflux RND transporter periplasmic adaptor subunit n=1 Tax=unclassified Pseudoalteromonas TaxID=194690 RepID=UPI001F44D6FF|nr:MULTISPECIES: efflux RND transporter periplasmic adaptor subunit [unclassified Pseudoalteromonas]MCF2827429.1 efflux RND transporter periplasmic adaptor subunit [Pseudoalteromonas sp. OF5H-5]MCF2832912.1 efflux RND transporter periplasmic adaptor subunit [Pseudoalteromonas sp. DL2-H6]MCF2923474.1 efflux RND transporter periplasmic adaptor subunit [Pseudoalteromonas sp. DL2-H1]